LSAGTIETAAVALDDGVFADLRHRVGEARWEGALAGHGWDFGADVAYIRDLCEHWAKRYPPDRLERRVNAFTNRRWEGLHFIHAAPGERTPGDGPRTEGRLEPLPVLLVHGWPTGPILYAAVIPRLVAAGHEVIVPSLPGFAWSDAPGRPLNVAGVSSRLRELMETALGHRRYAIHGEDWGAAIASRMAFDSPETVAALHISTLSVLPRPADLDDPPLAGAESRRRAHLHRDVAPLASPRGVPSLRPRLRAGRPRACARRLSGGPRGLAGGQVPALERLRRRGRAALFPG
jgi:pimeloyl-ACP methyl ester carboxylesterase